MNTSLRVATNTFYMLGSHILISLVGMITTMLVVRTLGPAAYGDLTLALAYFGFFMTLAESGLGLTILRKSQSGSIAA